MIFYLFCIILNIDPVKRHRGPTLLSDVHAHKFEDHVPVLCNEHGQAGQPIGPIEKAYDEFSKFLGTIAHEHS